MNNIPLINIYIQYKGQDGDTYTVTEEVKDLLDADLLHERIVVYLRQKKGKLIYFRAIEVTEPSTHLTVKTLDEAFPIDCDEKKFQCAIGPIGSDKWTVKGLMTFDQIKRRLQICKKSTSQKLLLSIGNRVTKEDGTSYSISQSEESELETLTTSEIVWIEYVSWL